MSAIQPRIERLSTGSAAFDRILGGGLPVALRQRDRRRAGRGQDHLRAPDALSPGPAGQEVPLLHDALRAVAEAHQLHAAVLLLRREPDRQKRVVFADLGSVIRRKGAEATLDRDRGPRRARAAGGGGHRQLQGAPGRPRRPPRPCGRSSTTSRSTRRAGARRACSSASTPRRRSRASRVRHRRRHHPALQPTARADRHPRGRGLEAARRRRA